ncbi:MAG: thioredoxin [Fusobacteriaceae bacterium]|jgi:thioredoxin 1|nr:thioredoxin [Fusobacteriaceae bacterium]
MSVQAVTKDNFLEEVLKSDQTVLVDFWAEWCGPCKMMGPVVDALAEENKGKFKVYKVNIDDEPELAQEFRIMSIPTLAVFKGGKLAEKLIGVQPKEELLAAITK